MVVTLIDDVLIGSDMKIFVSKVDVDYSNSSFKDIIFDPVNATKFLLVRKKIGSKIVIDDVKVVDDNLIDSMLISV